MSISSLLTLAARARVSGGEDSDASVGVAPDREQQRNERAGEGTRSLWRYLKRDRDCKEMREGPEPTRTPEPRNHKR